MTSYKRRAGLVLCILLLFLRPITLTGEESQTAATPNESTALLNSIHSHKIRGIMRRLNSLTYEREYTELELQQIQTNQIALMLEITRELTDSAEQLPDISPGSNLNESEQITFRAIANQLYRETRQLNEDVQKGHTRQIKQGYRRLKKTCEACHQLFRDR